MARARRPGISTTSVCPLRSVRRSSPRRVQHTKPLPECSAPISPSWAVAVYSLDSRERGDDRRPAACTTRAQTRPAWISIRIPLFPRSEPVCFTVTSASGRTVTVLPSRKVMRARPFAPVLIRSPSARFMPSTPADVPPAPAATRSTGGASTLRVAAAPIWAADVTGNVTRVARVISIATVSLPICHTMIGLLARETCLDDEMCRVSASLCSCGANAAPSREVPRFADERFDSVTERIDSVRTCGARRAGCPRAKRSTKALRAHIWQGASAQQSAPT